MGGMASVDGTLPRTVTLFAAKKVTAARQITAARQVTAAKHVAGVSLEGKTKVVPDVHLKLQKWKVWAWLVSGLRPSLGVHFQRKR